MPAAIFLLSLVCVLAAPSLADDDPAQRARDLIKEGHYTEAAVLGRDLLGREEARNGPDSLQVADVLDLIVEAERLDGKVKDEGTRALARRSIVIKEDKLGPDHPDVARSVNNLANLLVESGDYFGAKPHYERVLRIQNATLAPEDPVLAKTLTNFANLISDMGDYAGSRPLYERALAIKEKAYGNDDPQLISTLIGLGILSRLTGDYVESRTYCERAVRIAREKLRPGHPRRGNALATLASLASETGDYDEARSLLEETRALQEKELPPDHPDLAATLGDLANLHKEAGELKEARALYEKVLEMQGRSLEAESTYLVPILESLGEVLLELRDVDGARSNFERGRLILEKVFGPDHPDVAGSLDLLSDLLERKGDHTAARELLQRGLEIRRSALGEDHPLVATSLLRLARVTAASGDDSGAMDLAHQAETIGRHNLRVIARTLAERQALRYASTRPSGLDLELEVASHGGEASIRTAWDDLIQVRALVLDEMAGRHRSVVESEDSVVQGLWHALEAARAQEAALWMRGLEAQDPASYRRVLDAAREHEEQSERQLAEKSLRFRRERSRVTLGLSEVTKALADDSALVAYAVTRRSERYVAFVLRAGAAAPQLVDLGPKRTVDDVVTRWRAAVATEPSPFPAVALAKESEDRRVGADLKAMIWDPIASHLGGAKRVFIVPDGDLHLVSFAALPAGKTRYLVETGPLIHYLSAETDLVLGDPAPRSGTGLLAVGDPDFDGAAGGSVLARPKASAGVPVAARYRGPQGNCRETGALHFDSLPGARTEAKDVADIWARQRSNAGDTVVSLAGAKATKESFMRLAPKFRVVHLATHGFFLGDTCRSDRAFPSIGNPLLFSGLAFAGANRPIASDVGVYDVGIVTAEEIASLDLSRVVWVVLSGCDTGLGTIHPGEGVLGLRRAVRVAGAGSLVMSLWPAKDDTTRRWMNRLYERRLSGFSTAAAMRAASRDVIAARRSAGKSTHPFYWGAFVAAGDWR